MNPQPKPMSVRELMQIGPVIPVHVNDKLEHAVPLVRR